MTEYDLFLKSLFIPVLGRAYVSKVYPEYFYDDMSITLSKEVPNYLYKEIGKPKDYLLSAARSYVIDNIVKQFFLKFPKCNIIYLGAGLDSYYSRLNNYFSNFIEVDLKHILDVKKKYFKEEKNEKFIEGDFFDLSWLKNIDKEKPTIIIASNVFHYFEEDKVLSFIRCLKLNFKRAVLVFDVLNKVAMNNSNKIIKKTNSQSKGVTFCIDNPLSFSKKISSIIIHQRGIYEEVFSTIGRKLDLRTKSNMKYSDKHKLLNVITLKL